MARRENIKRELNILLGIVLLIITVIIATPRYLIQRIFNKQLIISKFSSYLFLKVFYLLDIKEDTFDTSMETKFIY